MKPENKLPVLASISDEMRAVLNIRQDDLPPWPAADDVPAMRNTTFLNDASGMRMHRKCQRGNMPSLRAGER
ncbi:acetyl esterase [Citrobacter amalonaticus]|nr:acetyl esterase [Citrobacter amalonaticus]